MIQGTGSSVGKSALTTAFCRIFAQDGYQVAPFKAQNMGAQTGLMSAVQYNQSLAAKVEPRVAMNPILLRPTSDVDAEVFINGKSQGVLSAQEYIEYKPALIEVIHDAITTLKTDFEVVIMEGAGSPSEVNLRDHDLVNMTAARLADAPVLLVADIDLGGVFAYVHGTLRLLLPEERSRIKGIIVNKFRGDPNHFKDGITILEELANLPVVGVIPFFNQDPNQELDQWAKHVRDNLDLVLIKEIMGLGGRL